MGRTSKKLLVRRELAKALGCDQRTVAKFQDEGMPVAVRGRGGRPSKFNAAACVAWKTKRDTSSSDTGAPAFMVARTRKELAQALEAEQRIATKGKYLVDAREVEARIADDISKARTKLLGLPRKARALLPHLTQADVLALDDLVRQALEELAGPARAPTP